MDLVPQEPSVERVARFQSLQAGQYWRALRSIADEGIDAGTVLLIQSIRWVDDAPHTIILRPHPSKYGKRVKLQVPREDGSVETIHFVYDEHRFLLDDFLRLFEFEPEHQAIRTGEIRQVQARINALQAELLETQASPTLLAKVVEEGLQSGAVAKDERDDDAGANNAPGRAEPPAGKSTLSSNAGTNLVAIATGTVGEAIGAGITASGVAQMRAAAQREHAIATIKAEWIQGKTSAIAEALQEMSPYYQEQAAAALAHTEDVRSYVAKLLQGIESLDLYVGKGVEVQTVRQGASAPRDVPLTFVQRKLLMDEELAVYTDLDEWFDFEKEELFFEAIRKHDGLVEQIFPTPRCVLVMAVTRRFIDYGNGFTNVARNDENRKVFLLVRDGMNVHRVFSPVESHLGAARLFPNKDDQESVFRGLDGSQIKFEDVAYTDTLAAHERFALHYKRFLLLACGLDHRLKLFGEFYEGPQSLNFVSMAFQDRYCRFLHDDDASTMLGGEERLGFQEWISQRNAFLRSGSRVLCNWNELMNPDTAPGACRSNRSDRGRGFDRRYDPKSAMDVAIAFKDGASTCVEVEVSGYSYSSHEDRTFNCKVNLTKFRNGHWEHVDLPFLCLDTVEPEDLRWYIHHRPSRRDHLKFIRFFKRALAHVESERVAERDSRERLRMALDEGNIGDPEERLSIVSNAVLAWRAANRGKPLPSFNDGHAPDVWKSVLDQMYMLAGEGNKRVREIEAFVRESGLTPLRLVLSGGAKLVAYAAPSDTQRDDRLEQHVWVHRITVEKGKTKYVEKARRWALLPGKAASETTLHEWPDAGSWGGKVSAFSSFQRKVEVMEMVSNSLDRLKPYMQTMSPEDFDSSLAVWKRLYDKLNRGASGYVRHPYLAIPVGVVLGGSKKLSLLCIGSLRSQVLLGGIAPSADHLNRLRQALVSWYDDKAKGGKRFDEELSGGEYGDWSLLLAPLELLEGDWGAFTHDRLFGSGLVVETLEDRPTSPLLRDWLAAWRDRNKKLAVWLADWARDADGSLDVDPMLGIELPEDYEVVTVREITLSAGEAPLPKYHRWLDLIASSDEEDDEGKSFWPSREDSGLKRCIEEVAPGWAGGYSTWGRVFPSRSRARAGIQSWVRDGDVRVVAAADLPDAPQPPEGVERWFALPASD